MQKYLNIIISVFAFILLNASITSQAQSIITRSSVIEQFKGKSYFIHFVKTGETLAEIAKAYDVSTDVIAAENPEAREKVYVNQVLKIPVTKSTYEVPSKPVNASAPGKTTPDIAPKGVEPEKVKTPQQPLKSEPTTKSKIPQEPVKAESVTQEAPAYHRVMQKQKVTYTEYTVKKKETLYGIAKKFDVAMDDIIDANPGLRTVEIGMILRIPQKTEGLKNPVSEEREKPAEATPALKRVIKTGKENAPVKFINYEVKPGETLYGIAKTNNISIESLLELNPELKTGLKTGIIIKIPTSGSKAETVPAKESENKPLKSEENPTGEVTKGFPCSVLAQPGQVYKVAMMLPFELGASDSILSKDVSSLRHAGAYKSFNFIEIYEGALLAMDSLEKTGARVKFYVYDSDSGNDTTKTHKILLKPELKDMDLIIGPVFAKSSATAARFAAKYQINIVNPLSRRGEILKGNTNIFKVQPSDGAIAEKLAAFIIRQHPGANVLVVRYARLDNPDLAKLIPLKIKSQLQSAGHSTSDIAVNDIVYSSEFFTGVSKHLSTTKENIIIVLSNNSVFIPDFISRLNNLRKSHNIMLLGGPELEALDPETNYLVNLNYHQYSFSWVDYTSPAVRNFRKKYQSRFSTEPEDDKYAYLGYDMTFFFVQALLHYGHDFGPCITNQPNSTESPFTFRKSGSKDGYENLYMNILKIENYGWVDAEKTSTVINGTNQN